MRLLFFVCLGASLAAAPMKSLFDGKSLKGWKQCNGQAVYAVEKGTIVGTTVEGSPNSFLCTGKTYGDFVLEYEIWADDVLNSGVQIRSHQYAAEQEVVTFNGKEYQKRKQPAGRVYGYQVETASEKSGASGGIYDEARRGWLDNPITHALKADQWNKYRVEAIGDHIRVWVNGVACADLVDPVDQEGFIALQVHSFKGEKPAKVRWRNLRIEDRGRHGWKRLEDAGWVKHGGGEWKVANGVIEGRQTPESQQRGFLLRSDDWSDFTVRLDYKTISGNSGVFFRMGDFEKGTEPNRMGFEIEVDPTRDAGGFQEPGRGARGWIHHTGPAAELKYYKPGDWNQMVISAHGGRIAVHINGVKTYEAKDDPGRKSGRLALQANPRQNMEVYYRNVERLIPY
jgi:hypothetical protein